MFVFERSLDGRQASASEFPSSQYEKKGTELYKIVHIPSQGQSINFNLQRIIAPDRTW
jgi:hypothetical protein